MKERTAFLLCLAFSALILGVIDAALIQKSYAYFGGEALNRPFALKAIPDFVMYGLHSLLFDVSVIGATLWGIYSVTRKIKHFSPWQQLYLATSSLLIILIFYTFVQMEVIAYFGAKFDLNVVLDLADNRISSLLSFISLQQVLIGTFIFLSFGVNILAAKYLVRFNGDIIPIISKRRISALSIILVGTVALVGDRFWIADQQSLLLGLSKKASFSLVDIVVKRATDFDGDGFGPLTVPRDPDNFDANVHAFAVEIPANGFDENGLAGDLPKIAKDVTRCQQPSINRLNHKNVIVVVVETFRSDLVNHKINGEEITPFLNRLAAGPKTSHTDFAVSNYGVTARAIQTIFAGCLGYNKESPFLFDVLRKHGYATFAVSAQSEDWGQTDAYLNLHQYDYFFDARQKDWSKDERSDWHKMKGILGTVDGFDLNKVIFDTLDKNTHRPFAMYINYQDLHYPYHSNQMPLLFIEKGQIHSDFFKKKNRDSIRRQYANAGRYFDRIIQQLFEGLANRDLRDNSVIVIIGDHPDSIYENNILGHAWTIDEHQKRTPLIVYNGRGSHLSPVGQEEIVNIIAASLEKNRPAGRIVPDQDKQVFVLTGPLKAPRLIGFLGMGSLIRYDLAANRLQVGENRPWQPIDKLNDADRNIFNKLIHHWESELFLQQKYSTPGAETR